MHTVIAAASSHGNLVPVWAPTQAMAIHLKHCIDAEMETFGMSAANMRSTREYIRFYWPSGGMCMDAFCSLGNFDLVAITDRLLFKREDFDAIRARCEKVAAFNLDKIINLLIAM